MAIGRDIVTLLRIAGGALLTMAATALPASARPVPPPREKPSDERHDETSESSDKPGDTDQDKNPSIEVPAAEHVWHGRSGELRIADCGLRIADAPPFPHSPALLRQTCASPDRCEGLPLRWLVCRYAHAPPTAS